MAQSMYPITGDLNRGSNLLREVRASNLKKFQAKGGLFATNTVNIKLEVIFMASVELRKRERAVFMPHKDYRLLNAMYGLSLDCAIYALYTSIFNFPTDLHLDQRRYWLIFTYNAYHGAAIGHWCKLFGAYKEETHWSKLTMLSSTLHEKMQDSNLSSKKEDIKKEFLCNAGITPEEFEKYHKSTKAYRDRHLIHREHNPDKINDGDLTFPITETAGKTAFGLTWFTKCTHPVKIKILIWEKKNDQKRIFKGVQRGCSQSRSQSRI